MSDTQNPGVPVWSCVFADPQGGAKLDDLTVGSKFAMSCKGEIAVEWDRTLPKVVFAKPADEFTLVVLGSEKLDAREAVFVVTGYKPGEHRPEYLRVLQGERGFEFAHPAWTIKSVIKPGDKPKPFGPFGPVRVGPPTWAWVLVALALLALAAKIGAWLRRRWRARHVKSQLKTFATALTPAHQFYRDARQLRRRLHVAATGEDTTAILADLERAFRLLLLRQYKVPALEGDARAIRDAMRRRSAAALAVVGPDIAQILGELGRLAGSGDVVVGDVEQLHRMAVSGAEKIERAGGGA